MSLLDELKKVPQNFLGGTGTSFIDADTLAGQQGERYRIQGVNAGEVEKVIDGQYKLGTAGGQDTTKIISTLANEQGFTNIVPLLDDEGKPIVDDFGRTIIDLKNDKGESLKTSLIEAGAFDINKYTTEQDIAARDIAEARRRQETLEGDYTANAFDQAAVDIKEAELAEGAKQWGFKRTALNEAQRQQYVDAGYGHVVSGNVQVRHLDRDINNNSLNPFSDSWDQAWTGVGEAAYGVANMFGETTGLEGVAQWGADGVAKQQAKLGEYGRTILDYTDVDGLGSAFEYLGNNLAMSLPYMGIIVASTVAAPFTGGLSLTAPAAIYSGQTWNEMEGEKNASVAIGSGILQATFDRLGLSLIVSKGVGTKELTRKAIDALVKKGMTKEQAKSTLVNTSRREMAGLAGDVQKIAKSQIEAKAVAKDLLKRSLFIGAPSEGLTEMAQEATAYLAATQGSDKVFDWEELKHRLVSAGIAGSALGGGISAGGSAINTAAWADVAYRTSTDTQTSASDAELYANLEKEEHGRVASIEELAADARARSQINPGATIDQRAEAHNERQATKTNLDRTTEAISNVSSLWRGATRNIFTPELQSKYRSARILADMFGGNLQRIFHGSNFENSKHLRVATYKNMIMRPETFYGGSRIRSTKIKMSDDGYRILNEAIDKDGNFNPNLVPKDIKDRDTIIQIGKEMIALGDRMHSDQKKHNPQLGYIKNYLFKYKSFNKKAIQKDQKKFTELLKSEYGMSQLEAKRITDEIIDNPEVADIDTAFSVVKGGISPEAHKKRSLGLAENKNFQDFMERDIFANVSQAVKSASRYTAHREYIGKDGAVINQLLDDMQAEGASEVEVDKVAKQLKDYLDAESGNYKRPKSEVGRKFQRIQKNIMMFTTLTSLPLAVISSLPEYALTHSALTKDQLFGKQGSLLTSAKTAANMLWNGWDTTLKEKDYKARNPKEIIRDLGFYEWDVGAATTTGVTEINSWQQSTYEMFFKWNLLQGWTNYTRAVRASMAGDYMFDKAQTIGEWKLSGEPRTREIQEAEEALRNLGLDVDTFVDQAQMVAAGIPLDPAQEQVFGEAMREATFNFINNAVALPQSQNRPLIYQDPRFALFTQFQGFMATFTANHIPKLWGEYVKRGTPAMKYSAFATMATMILLGFVSQHIKDGMKYGPYADEDEEYKTGANPYLDTPEYIQRGIRASGLVGTGERVLDLFFPIYEKRSDGVGDWAWNQASGESPAISYIERVAKGLGHYAEGDTEKGAYNLLKATPFIGPATSINKSIADYITKDSWNPKGE